MKNYKNKVCMVIGFISLIFFILISIIMMCKGMPKGGALCTFLFLVGWILPVIGYCIDK